MGTDALRFEAVDGADEAFLLELFFQTRRGAFEPLGWSEEQLRGLLEPQYRIRKMQYEARFPSASRRKIVAGGQAVGRLDTAEEDGHLHIIDIAVMPEAQGQGIGSRALQEALDAADGAGLPVRLEVEASSPALRLYTRLGFIRLDGDGVYLRMERPARRPRPLPEPAVHSVRSA